MTVTNSRSYSDWMVGTGAQKNWPYSFSILDQSSVRVQVANRPNSIGEWEEYDNNIELHAVTSSSGYVTYPVTGDPLESNKYLRIVRQTPLTQDTLIGREGDFSPEIHEKALDKLTMIVQEVTDKSGLITDQILEAKTAAVEAAAATAAALENLLAIATPNINLDLLQGIETDLIPSIHLNRGLNKSVVRVGITGDSLTTFLATEDGNRINGLSPQLTRWLRSHFPDKSFEFFYRGIGGMAYFYLDSIVTDFPIPSNTEWEPSETEKWSETLAGLNLDWLFVGFGMNDGNLWNVGQFQPDNMMEALSTISKSKSRPNIILCTNLKPSTTTADVNFSSFAAQNGRDAVAGYTRSVAKYFNWGLLDFNRWMNIARDGEDVRGSFMQFMGTLSGSIPLSHETLVRDYVAAVTVENIPVDFFNPGGSGERLQFPIAPFNKSIVHIFERSGKLEFEVISDIIGAGNTGAGRMRYKTDVDAPTSGETFTCYMAITDNWLNLKLMGTEVFNGKIIRHGGKFQPYFMYSNNAAGVAAEWDLYLGVNYPSTPILEDEDLWALPELGGNGVNHPNSVALGLLYNPVLAKVSPRGVPEERVLCLLKGRSGLALDGTTGKYALVQPDGTTTIGAIEDIVTSWVGGITELEAYEEDGYRTGFRIGPLTGAIINFNALWGSDISECLFAVEAKTLAAGTAVTVGGVARAADFGPRIQFSAGSDNVLVGASLNDSSAVSAQFNYGAMTSWRSASFMALNDTAQCFVHGRYLAVDTAGLMPTALNRVKLGLLDSAGTNGDIAISKVILLPGAQNFDMAQAMSL